MILKASGDQQASLAVNEITKTNPKQVIILVDQSGYKQMSTYGQKIALEINILLANQSIDSAIRYFHNVPHKPDPELASYRVFSDLSHFEPQELVLNQMGIHDAIILISSEGALSHEDGRTTAGVYDKDQSWNIFMAVLALAGKNTALVTPFPASVRNGSASTIPTLSFQSIIAREHAPLNRLDPMIYGRLIEKLGDRLSPFSSIKYLLESYPYKEYLQAAAITAKYRCIHTKKDDYDFYRDKLKFDPNTMALLDELLEQYPHIPDFVYFNCFDKAGVYKQDPIYRMNDEAKTFFNEEVNKSDYN